jgi:hypothetical protein
VLGARRTRINVNDAFIFAHRVDRGSYERQSRGRARYCFVVRECYWGSRVSTRRRESPMLTQRPRRGRGRSAVRAGAEGLQVFTESVRALVRKVCVWALKTPPGAVTAFAVQSERGRTASALHS